MSASRTRSHPHVPALRRADSTRTSGRSDPSARTAMRRSRWRRATTRRSCTADHPSSRRLSATRELWAQASSFGDKILPPEMRAVLVGRALTADRIGAALGIWRTYCQRASAGDARAGELAVLMTGSISSYFAVVAERIRSDNARSSRARWMRFATRHTSRHWLNWRALSARAGDVRSAQVWFAACDPRSADLQADTAYRVTYASLATLHGDFRNVLGALGPAPGSIPVALPSRLQVCRDPRERDREARRHRHGRRAARRGEAQALPAVAKPSPRSARRARIFELCPQSMPLARMQW